MTTPTDDLAQALRAIRLKFTTGNDVPVERAWIKATEWRAVEDALAAHERAQPASVPDGWRDEPPAQDGDFFYTGPLPDGDQVTAVVQVFTHPDGIRRACLFIPPGWRGDASRKLATMYTGALDEWRGRWAGPDHGLCCVTAAAPQPAKELIPCRCFGDTMRKLCMDKNRCSPIEAQSAKGNGHE